MAANSELVVEFLEESRENLDRLDHDFVELEREMGDASADRLASIFRTIHTIKGTCGFLGFEKLQGVAHVGENLLSKLRDGKLAVTTDIITALLKLVDAVREMLANIESGGAEGDADYGPLVARLTDLSGPAAATVQAEATPAAETVPAAPIDDPAAALRRMLGVPPAAPSAPGGAATPVVPDAADPQPAEPAHAAPAAATSAGIRVDVGLLDKLMNLVGELVLARNQILQHTAGLEGTAMTGAAQRLNLITTELQEGVMKTRMQPIDNVWSKFPRVVRDLSQMCGKQVRVEMEGRATELDKTIIEAIKDPLTHIIRNSVDHGIESPDKRRAAGKSPEGRLFLRAFHEGGQVNIEIADDGGGIPPAKVKAKAVEKGLITADQAARMGDREAVNLVFLPGFSTAEKITNVSGRGVGMDVVKTNLEKIGGSVDIQSKPGEGTTIRIKIPLTLAIIPALVVTSGGERFAIPQVSLLELVRVEAEQVGQSVERIGQTPVYRLRGNLLPLVNLAEQLNTAPPAPGGPASIVVLQADGRQFGLVVDEINDTEEIVVKPLGKLLKGASTFAGATIMGDGRVALILDVTGLAQRAHVIGRAKELAAHQAEADRAAAGRETQTLLLLQAAGDRRLAIPLSLVARLEEFAADRVERSGRQRVVQYRDQIMPLVSLSEWLDPASAGEPIDGAAVQAVVYRVGDRSVGLVVDRIVDVVEQAVETQSTGARPGILGTAVVGKRVTELLDVEGIILQTLPHWADARPLPLAA